MKHAAGRPVRQPRPQRQGQAAGPARVRLEQLPYWIVLCGAMIGLLSIRGGQDYVRGGTLGMAGVLLMAAVARLVLPERRAGMLRSRRRLVDVAALGALGAGLLIAGLVLPPP